MFSWRPSSDFLMKWRFESGSRLFQSNAFATPYLAGIEWVPAREKGYMFLWHQMFCNGKGLWHGYDERECKYFCLLLTSCYQLFNVLPILTRGGFRGFKIGGDGSAWVWYNIAEYCNGKEEWFLSVASLFEVKSALRAGWVDVLSPDFGNMLMRLLFSTCSTLGRTPRSDAWARGPRAVPVA